MAEWIWMRNEDTGGVTRFPAEAREGWEARGWVETEAPVEDDLAPEERAVRQESPTPTEETPAESPENVTPINEKKGRDRG